MGGWLVQARHTVGSGPGREIRGWPNNHGYRQVHISVGGETKYASVHVLIAEAFLGPRRNRRIHFKNGDRSDCRADNLEYAQALKSNGLSARRQAQGDG